MYDVTLNRIQSNYSQLVHGAIHPLCCLSLTFTIITDKPEHMDSQCYIARATYIYEQSLDLNIFNFMSHEKGLGRAQMPCYSPLP